MEMLMSFEAKAAAKKNRQAAFDGKQEGRLRHAGCAEMISPEPIAWNGLVEDQCEERQQQAKTAEQRDRDKGIMSAIDCCRCAREQPCYNSGHINFWFSGGLGPDRSVKIER